MWIFLQLVALGTIALLFNDIGGWFSAQSVLLGGSAWMIPGLYFSWRMKRTKSIFDVKKMLKSFFFSEVVKLLLSFGIVALVLLNFKIDLKGFLVGYTTIVLLSVISYLCGIEHG